MITLGGLKESIMPDDLIVATTRKKHEILVSFESM